MIIARLCAFTRNLYLIQLVFLLLPFKVCAQNFGIHFTGNQKSVSIPFETYNNLIVFSIVLNGTLPLKFILDTGVRSTILLDRSITDLFGVHYTRNITLTGIGNNRTVEAYVANNLSVTLPGMTSGSISMLVLKKDYLNLRNHLGTDVHGIIGYDLFSHFVVKIDYQHKMLVFYRPEKFRPRKSYESFDLSIEDAKPFFEVPLQITDSTSLNAKLMIDTGASHALILHAASDDQISVPLKNIATKLGRGLTGDVEGHLGRINGCKLGKYRLHDIITSFPNDSTFYDSLFVVKRNGSVGGEILSKFTVIIDFIHKKMYLKKNAKFRTPFDYNMSGLEVTAKGEDLNKYYVDMVRKGSVADSAGIMEGDEVVRLQGIPSEKLTMDKIYEILNSYNKRKIRIWVQRADMTRRVEFVLQSEI